MPTRVHESWIWLYWKVINLVYHPIKPVRGTLVISTRNTKHKEEKPLEMRSEDEFQLKGLCWLCTDEPRRRASELQENYDEGQERASELGYFWLTRLVLVVALHRDSLNRWSFRTLPYIVTENSVKFLCLISVMFVLSHILVNFDWRKIMMHTKFYTENLKERDNLEDKGVVRMDNN